MTIKMANKIRYANDAIDKTVWTLLLCKTEKNAIFIFSL